MASSFLAEGKPAARGIVGIVLLSQVVVFISAYNQPFFGDAIASISKPAIAIYESGLERPFNYPDADPGHPTLFPFLIALGWTAFGKSLWWPHLLQSLFAAGTALILSIFFLRRYSGFSAILGLMLLLISPLFVSQSTGISLQMPLTFFFMASWGAIAANRFRWLYLLLPLMMLSHLQAILLLPVLAALQIFYKQNDNPLHFSGWWSYVVALGVLAIWFVAHYLEFGWVTASPNYERGSPGITGFIANLLRSIWRLVDFGYFLLWLPLLFFKGKNEKPALWREFAFFGILFVIPLAALFVYPPAHRYFLPLLFWLPFAFAQRIESQSLPRRALWIVGAFLLLVSGNFWVYPGRCASDANISYRAWYVLEEKIISDLPEAEIYTYAPLANEPRFTNLNNDGWHFLPIYNRPLFLTPYVLRSNLNCEFNAGQIDTLRQWPGKEWRRGGIYARIYANPDFVVPEGFRILPEPKGEGIAREMKEWLGR